MTTYEQKMAEHQAEILEKRRYRAGLKVAEACEVVEVLKRALASSEATHAAAVLNYTNLS